jgi:hypothetical protein
LKCGIQPGDVLVAAIQASVLSSCGLSNDIRQNLKVSYLSLQFIKSIPLCFRKIAIVPNEEAYSE